MFRAACELIAAVAAFETSSVIVNSIYTASLDEEKLNRLEMNLVNDKARIIENLKRKLNEKKKKNESSTDEEEIKVGLSVGPLHVSVGETDGLDPQTIMRYNPEDRPLWKRFWTEHAFRDEVFQRQIAAMTSPGESLLFSAGAPTLGAMTLTGMFLVLNKYLPLKGEALERRGTPIRKHSFWVPVLAASLGVLVHTHSVKTRYWEKQKRATEAMGAVPLTLATGYKPLHTTRTTPADVAHHKLRMQDTLVVMAKQTQRLKPTEDGKIDLSSMADALQLLDGALGGAKDQEEASVPPTDATYPLVWPGGTPLDPFTAQRLAFHVGFLPFFSAAFLQGLLLPRYMVAFGKIPAYILTTAVTLLLHGELWSDSIGSDTLSATCGVVGQELQAESIAFKSICYSVMYMASGSIMPAAAVEAYMALQSVWDEFLSRRDIVREHTFLWRLLASLLQQAEMMSFLMMTDMRQRDENAGRSSMFSQDGFKGGHRVPIEKHLVENLAEKIMKAYGTKKVKTASGQTEREMDYRDVADFLTMWDAFTEGRASFGAGAAARPQHAVEALLGVHLLPHDDRLYLRHCARTMAIGQIMRMAKLYPTGGLSVDQLAAMLRWLSRNRNGCIKGTDAEGGHRPTSDPSAVLRSAEKELLRWHEAKPEELVALWGQVCRGAEESQMHAAREWLLYQGGGHTAHHILPFPLYPVRVMDHVSLRKYREALNSLTNPSERAMNQSYARWASAADEKRMFVEMRNYGVTKRVLAKSSIKHFASHQEKTKAGREVDTWRGPDGKAVTILQSWEVTRAVARRANDSTHKVLNPHRK